MNTKCEHCGESFEHDKPRRFCSVACRNHHNAAQQMRNGKIATCPVCGKEFYIQPSYVKRGMTYCSAKCKYTAASGENSRLWKGGPKPRKFPKREKVVFTPKPCPICGKEFTPKSQDQIYCSRACHNRPRKVTVICEICGKSFQRKPAEIKHGRGCFCSMSCFGVWCSTVRVGENHPCWKGGGEDYYGGNWNTQKRAARKRDNNTCRRCGATSNQVGRDMDVHHIKRFRSFDSYKDANQLPNLICLCPTCHRIVEQDGIDFDMEVLA